MNTHLDARDHCPLSTWAAYRQVHKDYNQRTHKYAIGQQLLIVSGTRGRGSRFATALRAVTILQFNITAVNAIHPLRFPLALHRNIADCLKEVRSSRFAAPFEAVPLHPWVIEELITPHEREEVGNTPENICSGCL